MKKITVEFEVEFGSEHQQRSFHMLLNTMMEALKMTFGSEHQQRSFHMLLNTMMEALKMTMDRGHNDNKITCVIDTHDGYKIKKV